MSNVKFEFSSPPEMFMYPGRQDGTRFQLVFSDEGKWEVYMANWTIMGGNKVYSKPVIMLLDEFMDYFSQCFKLQPFLGVATQHYLLANKTVLEINRHLRSDTVTFTQRKAIGVDHDKRLCEIGSLDWNAILHNQPYLNYEFDKAIELHQRRQLNPHAQPLVLNQMVVELDLSYWNRPFASLETGFESSAPDSSSEVEPVGMGYRARSFFFDSDEE